MEHLQHFGLSQDPFGNEPDLRFYFDSACHRDATMRVERGLRQNKGLTVLTGDPGTGKTLLARRLLEALEEEVFEVALLVMLPGATDAQTVLTRFARQLGVEEPGEDRSAVLGQIYEQLAIVREEGRHGVLIIDDAHILSADAVAEIGGLLNMEYEDARLLSLLLVGTPELDDCMQRDAALHQRVDVRVHLQPLDLDDTAAYLAHRLSIVGGKTAVVPSPAVGSLYKFSRGRPRLINTLADNALFEAFLSGRAQIDGGDVERAAGDLGVGMDPGQTYTGLPPSPAPVAPVSSSSAIISDPGQSRSQSLAPADSGTGNDLASLLEVPEPATEELTTLLPSASDSQGGTFDLDAEVNAVLAERDDQSAGELPIFEAENHTSPGTAEATRIAFEEPEAAGSGEVAELDDLFVELIDE